MKILQKICFVLLLTTFSSVYGDSCFEKPHNVDDCRVRAEQGDSYAQYKLGNMYEKGFGVEQDYSKSRMWYRKSADQGSSLSQYKLGNMYEKGFGVEQDYSKARMWYRKSADQGYSLSQYSLGNMYEKGLGVEQDYSKARMWYRKSADQGYSLPQKRLNYMNEQEQFISSNDKESTPITELEIEKSGKEEGIGTAESKPLTTFPSVYGGDCFEDKDVDDCLMKSELGDSDAQFNLGNMYYRGQGVSKDYKEALKWYRKGADQGNVRAIKRVGDVYYKGKGVIKDNKEAVKWYTKAAEQGLSGVQIMLGFMYYRGTHGVTLDYKESFKWFRLSAEQGGADAQYILGVMYNNGEGVPQDKKEAVKWYRLSAEQGFDPAVKLMTDSQLDGDCISDNDVDDCLMKAEQGDSGAQFNLGKMYYRGQGDIIVQDYVMAHMYWNIAAVSGHENAIKNRDSLSKKMTLSQLEKAQDLAREWMRNHQ